MLATDILERGFESLIVNVTRTEMSFGVSE